MLRLREEGLAAAVAVVIRLVAGDEVVDRDDLPLLLPKKLAYISIIVAPIICVYMTFVILTIIMLITTVNGTNRYLFYIESMAFEACGATKGS